MLSFSPREVLIEPLHEPPDKGLSVRQITHPALVSSAVINNTEDGPIKEARNLLSFEGLLSFHRGT